MPDQRGQGRQGLPADPGPEKGGWGCGALPNIIFDDGSAVYYSDDDREVLIHLNCVSGATANTGEGAFHWY